MTITVEERVEIGARFFDETVPDWRDIVSVEYLDLSTTSACPLGQLFGWQRGVEALYEWAAANLAWPDCDVPLVEVAGFEKADETYAELQLAWERAIANVPECDGCDQDPWRTAVHYGTCPLAPVTV